MTVAELYVLLGLNYNKSQWEGAIKTMGALQAAGAAVKGVFDTLVGVIEGVFGMVEGAAEKAVHLRSVAQQMGMSVEATQEWAYVAEQAGGNINELSIGVVRLQKNLKALAEGRNTIGTRSLRALGITATEAHRSMTKMDGVQPVMLKLADAFHKQGVEALSAAEANEIFGRNSKTVISDLLRGSKGLEELFEQIRSRGAIMSTDEVENLANLGNQFNNVKNELQSFIMQGIARMAPEISAFLKELTEWISKHRELIRDVVGALVRGVLMSIQLLAAVLDKVFGFLEENGELATAILWGISGAIVALTGLFIAAGIAMAVAFLPLILTVIAIVGMIRGIGVAWDWVNEHFHAVVDFWEPKLTWLRDQLEGIGSLISESLGLVWDTVKEYAEPIINWITEKIQWVIDKATWLKEHTVGYIISAADALKSSFNGAKNFITGGGSSAPSASGSSPDTWDRLRDFGARKGIVKPDTTSAPMPATTSRGGAGTDQRPNVTIGPTTVNITAKDAKDAKEKFDADAMERSHRHAAASFEGGSR